LETQSALLRLLDAGRRMTANSIVETPQASACQTGPRMQARQIEIAIFLVAAYACIHWSGVVFIVSFKLKALTQLASDTSRNLVVIWIADQAP